MECNDQIMENWQEGLLLYPYVLVHPMQQCHSTYSTGSMFGGIRDICVSAVRRLIALIIMVGSRRRRVLLVNQELRVTLYNLAEESSFVS